MKKRKKKRAEHLDWKNIYTKAVVNEALHAKPLSIDPVMGTWEGCWAQTSPKGRQSQVSKSLNLLSPPSPTAKGFVFAGEHHQHFRGIVLPQPYDFYLFQLNFACQMF